MTFSLSSFSASKEKEIVKKMYTMLLDAYGCLGILQVCAPGGWNFGSIRSFGLFMDYEYKDGRSESVTEDQGLAA
jgi:hypothetical protein